MSLLISISWFLSDLGLSRLIFEGLVSLGIRPVGVELCECMLLRTSILYNTVRSIERFRLWTI